MTYPNSPDRDRFLKAVATVVFTPVAVGYILWGLAYLTRQVKEEPLEGVKITSIYKKYDVYEVKGIKSKYYAGWRADTSQGCFIIREEDVPELYAASSGSYFKPDNRAVNLTIRREIQWFGPTSPPVIIKILPHRDQQKPLPDRTEAPGL